MSLKDSPGFRLITEEAKDESQTTNIFNPPPEGKVTPTPPAGFEVIRFQITADINKFQLAAQLPADTAIWRVKNTDASTLVYVSIDDPNPSIIVGRTPIIELEPKQVDVPAIVPIIIGKPITIYLARASTATSPTVEIVYTYSKDPRVLASLALGIPPTSSIGPVSLSGLNVQISGQSVSIAGGINVSGSTVYTANPIRGLIFSGFVSWVSGNTSGNPVASTFGPPSVFGQDDVVVIGLQHGALSSDVTLIVEKAVLMGGIVAHLELARFSQNRGTSGIAQPIRGIFAGGTSGRILALHSNTLVEPVTGNLVVYHL